MASLKLLQVTIVVILHYINTIKLKCFEVSAIKKIICYFLINSLVLVPAEPD